MVDLMIAVNRVVSARMQGRSWRIRRACFKCNGGRRSEG